MLQIHGQNGQHAQDLIKRGILPSEQQSGWDGHIVVVPISVTRKAIDNIFANETAPEQILNLAGVMGTSPKGVSNIHFLFGPGASTGLKVAVAGEVAPLMQQVICRVQSLGIEIIHTAHQDHDQAIAVIQGLSHFFLTLVGTTPDKEIQEKLINPWRAPASTIQDMIFENPSSQAIIRVFLEKVEKNGDLLGTFRSVCDEHLSGVNQKNFGTPNFQRILDFSHKSESPILLSDNQMQQACQIHIAPVILRERIERIRGNNT